MTKTRNPGPITMYGADWCGDCRRAKAWFDDQAVDYTYVDLIEEPDETATVLERNNGRKSIPVIVFADDSHLTEPSNADLEAKVAALEASPATGRAGVADNEDAQRFELHNDQGELLSFADYRMREGTVIIPHVETAREHRGQGNAARLMEGVVENLRSTERRVMPLCPYAAGYLRDRPETHDVLAIRA